MFRVKSQQDIGAGVLFMAIGIAGVYFGRDLTYGTSMRMGPGFFPIWLSWIIMAIGAVIMFRGLSFDGPAIDPPKLRPIILILGSIVAFGFLINPLGLALTTIVLTIIAAYARPSPNLIETLIFGVGMAIFAVVAFIYGLGQPLPVWWGN
jgi:hypothetical protein